MHNLQLTEDQELIVETVRKFTADVVAPKVLEHDEHGVFAREEFAGLAELGLIGVVVGEASGGAGMGFLPFVGALEEIGGQSGSLAWLLIGQVRSALTLEGAAAAPLGDAIAGARLCCFVGPEHRMQCAGARITGRAEFAPAGAEADLFVVEARDGAQQVVCTVEAAHVVRTPLVGVGLGLASTGAARLSFDGAPATVVATGDAAHTAIARAQLAAQLGTAATCTGAGLACVAAARKHAGERIAFGKPLLAQQAVARKLVESRRAVDAARQLTWHAARLADLGAAADGRLAAVAALQARIAAVDALVLAADEAIQIHGGYGYTVEYHVERHYRDGKTLEVLDGGNELLRDRLAQLQFA